MNKVKHKRHYCLAKYQPHVYYKLNLSLCFVFLLIFSSTYFSLQPSLCIDKDDVIAQSARGDEEEKGISGLFA